MEHRPVDAQTLGMAAIGLSVAVAATVVPGTFFRTFGIAEPPSGAAKLGWRLFAVRTATISVLAATGNRTARETFLPVQLLDQATWWWGYSRREIPLRTAALATVASGAIIALDLTRRTTSSRPRLDA
jgi:hypothetical protein